MLTARHVLTAVLLVAALSLAGMAYSLWQSTEPSPLGGDSYGTRAHGQRGAFELLSELKVPVERSVLPPEASRDRAATLVLWGPHPSLMQLEPVYLQQISNWVKAGGRVVVALPRPDIGEIMPLARGPRTGRHAGSLLQDLGLAKVAARLVDLDESEDAKDDAKNDANNESGRALAAAPEGAGDRPRKKPSRSREFELFTARDSSTEIARVDCGGDLRAWQDAITTLEVPQHELQVLDTSDEEPAGWLRIKTAQGTEETLVASYRAGQGEIVLVGDPELLENRLLAQADNSLLAWRLLVASGRPVVWDEFYHGLTIRGNPLYLLRREPFGALMAAVLILIAVCVWRQAVRFGPPTAAAPIPRRTLAEYIETMARLYRRSRRSQPYLLAEMRSGMLWLLRSDLGLHLGQENLETIAAVLRRKRPEQASRLVDAVSGIDRALAAGADLPEKETVLTLQRVSACL